MRFSKLITGVIVGALALGVIVPLSVNAGAAKYGPDSDFYQYTGSASQLDSLLPGTALNTRTFKYTGVWFQDITAVQILHRATTATGASTTNMATVLIPTKATNIRNVVVNGIAYDSLDPLDEPSVQVQKQLTVASTEDIGGWLSKGYAVILPDTEGQKADMTAGREYGMNTLDAIRAAFNTPATKISSDAKVVLLGYSGGAWSTMWAAQLASSYAPDVNGKLVGVAVGGLPVNAAHIVQYLSGSALFSGEVPTSVIGMARAYGVDFRPYMNSKGVSMYNSLQKASLGDVIGRYWGLKFTDLLKPEYQNPNKIPDYVRIVNDNNLGLLPAPSVPVYIVQGDAPWGTLGTNNHPTLGTGDGATITKDVRTLAKQFCGAGNKTSYNEISWSDHLSAAISWQWVVTMKSWVQDRFNGKTAPNNCSTIPAGNSLAAEKNA